MASAQKSKSAPKPVKRGRAKLALRKPRRKSHARKRVSRVVSAKLLRDRRLVAGSGLALAAAVLGFALLSMPRKPAAPQAPGSRQEHASSSSPELDQALARQSRKPAGERLIHWAIALGQDPSLVPRLAALPGRPSIQDSAPIVPSSFDCTTFVEMATALARSATSGELFAKLIEVRYKDSRTTFFDRNHFPEADWLSNNARNGVFKDVTEKIATDSGVQARTESKTIDRGGWLARQMKKGEFRGLASEPPASWREPAAVSVKYLPVAELDRFTDHLPAGAVVNIVRGNRPSQPVLITHQGILFRANGVVYMRHSKHDGRVRTVELKNYLTSHEGISWPVIGLNLLMIND